MKVGDRVRAAPRSWLRDTVGDALGVVRAVDPHSIAYAVTVEFPGIYLSPMAEREFEFVRSAPTRGSLPRGTLR